MHLTMRDLEVFAQAIEIPDLDKRKKFVDAACGDDFALRRELERLLASYTHTQTESLLEDSPVDGQLVKLLDKELELNCQTNDEVRHEPTKPWMAPTDETIELDVVSDNSDLGLLIGPKGQTLSSVHELSRAVLQRQEPGQHVGRVRIDIGSYRQRRREALARFVRDQAAAVVESGVSRALEPMNAVDRKVVHDTVNEIDGVSTISEGQDPGRRVVIVPSASAE